MKLLTDIWVLTGRKLRETLRQPVWAVMMLSLPIVFLVLFTPLLQSLQGSAGFTRGSVMDVFLPGLLVLMAYTNVSMAGYLMLGELESGVVERLRVTPVSRFALLMGSLVRDVLVMAVPAAVLMAIAIPFGFHLHWGGAALLLALLTLLTVAASAGSSALALVLRRPEGLTAVTNGTQMPLILLSGMMLPISLAPEWMRVVAHLDPLYYAVDGSRDLAYGILTSPTVGIAFLVMGGLAVIATAWATGVYRKAIA